MTRGSQMPRRTLRVLAGPPLCRDAWRDLTQAVKDGAAPEDVEAFRAVFARTLERYGK